MAVDTHVFRVANRIGLVKNARTALAVELQLTRQIPANLLHEAHHWLILHGRYVCTARNPSCKDCGLSEFCEYYKKRGSLINEDK
jgi:endonuclease III